MKPNWSEQKVSAGMAPWIAKLAGVPLTLFVQPWYGDGINWRVIIQHHDWTLTLKKRFSDRGTAAEAAVDMAQKLRACSIDEEEK
jgi:hypothetical protein